jgi:uncharacterized protein
LAIIEDSRGIPQIRFGTVAAVCGCHGYHYVSITFEVWLMLGFGAMKTVLLLICSNVFMTIAWYGHLKYKKAPLIAVIVVSWLIAFFEYCFQVPANRIGYGEFTAFQLKIIQEVITLCVFVAFAWIYLGEHVRWNHVVSFLFIVGAVVFGFWGKL